MGGLLHDTAGVLGQPPCSPMVLGAVEGALPPGSEVVRRGRDEVHVHVPSEPLAVVIAC